MSASWSRENNLHLTLKFLGDIPITRIDDVSAVASAAVHRCPPFDVILSGCGVFPPRGKPNVLWIGIEDPTEGLNELQRRLEDQCAARGFARESRLYHPHLTIARIRKPQGARRLAEAHLASQFAPKTFGATELIVFRSELRPEGSKHTPISRHVLE